MPAEDKVHWFLRYIVIRYKLPIWWESFRMGFGLS